MFTMINQQKFDTIKKHITQLVAAVSFCVMATSVYAVQNAAPYLSAKRYNLGGQLAGTISPDPDGSGPLRFLATRHLYYSNGLLKSVETGQLSSWQHEDIAPANWSGFSISTKVTYTYDQYGRKATVKTTGGSDATLTQFSYDSQSRVECEAVRMNPAIYSSLPSSACSLGSQGSYGPDRIKKFTYDAYDQVLTEARAYGTSLSQLYVKNVYSSRLLTDQYDANNNRTKLEYDGYKRLKKRIYPDKNSAGYVNTNDYNYYEYDVNGNLDYERKRNGAVIRYEYDANNRMTKKDVSNNAQDVYYDYDLRGLTLYSRYGATYGNGITNGFDGFGNQLVSNNNLYGITRIIRSEYDDNNNRDKITHPDNRFFEYTFDGLNRLNGLREYVSSSSTTPILAMSYRSNGKRQNITRNGYSTTTYNYDGLGRLSNFVQNMSGSSYDLTNTFSYNPASQVRQLTQSNSYYQYTGNENKQGVYTPNGLNQYTNINGQNITYDANGNLTSDGTLTYNYDDENRLISTTGAVSSTFKYDPLGRLYEVIIGTIKRQFLYDGDALVAEYDGMTGATNLTNSPVKRYVHGDQVDEPLVEYSGSATTSSNRRYLHADHQGSIIAHTTSTGSAVERLSYDSFGIPSASNEGRFGYTGQIWFPELGLYYYKARVYSPKLGRFLQTDPIFYEDQMNMYAYVHNDPLNMTDPTGKVANLAAAAIGGLAAGVGSIVYQGLTKGEVDFGKAGIAAASGLAVGLTLGAALAVEGVAATAVAVTATEGVVLGTSLGVASGAATAIAEDIVADGKLGGEGALISGASPGGEADTQEVDSSDVDQSSNTEVRKEVN